MEAFHDWLTTIYRVNAASHGLPDEPIHCKWVDCYLQEHEKTWANYEEFCNWLAK